MRSAKTLSAIVILSAAVAGCEMGDYPDRARGDSAPPRVETRTYADAASPAQDNGGYAAQPAPAYSDAGTAPDNNQVVADDASPPDVIDDSPDDQNVQYFDQDLSPYGDWVVTADFGRCFRPRGVAADWRPYTDGHWVYTDDVGWLWASNEPFGDICDHYGRWTQDSHAGWCWVPGRQWAPAWVAWREGGGDVGWAPLPPLRHGEHNIRDEELYQRVRPDQYTFVDERYVADADWHSHSHPVQQNVTIINKTTNITNIRNENGKVVNRSLDVHKVEQASGKQVQHLKLAESDKRGKTEVHGNEVAVYQKKDIPAKKAPQARPAAEKQAPANAKPEVQTDAQKREAAAERSGSRTILRSRKSTIQPRAHSRNSKPPKNRKTRDKLRNINSRRPIRRIRPSRRRLTFQLHKRMNAPKQRRISAPRPKPTNMPRLRSAQIPTLAPTVRIRLSPKLKTMQKPKPTSAPRLKRISVPRRRRMSTPKW